MPFTDNFNGESSEVDLAAHVPSGGAAWTRVDGAANHLTVISAGWAVNNTNDDAGALYRCDDQGSSAHYTQFKTLDENAVMFVANRATNRSNFFGVRTRAGTCEVFKRTAGAFTSLGASGASTVKADDVVRFEVSAGNVHTTKVNGIQVHQVTDSFNSTETRQGLVARSRGRSSWLDDYEAGPLSAPTPMINSITASDITSSGARITLGVTR